jgi:FkbM family methyltransferase
MTNFILSILKFFGEKYSAKLNNIIVNNNDTLKIIKNKEKIDIIDVGVYHGTDFLIENFPNSFHYLFEPNTECNPYIAKNYSNLKFKLFNVGLSDVNKIEKLSINGSGSSIHDHSALSPLAGIKFPKKKIEIKRFDDFMQLKSKRKYLLKIDTEGHELSVLKGSRRNLKKIDFVLMETRIIPSFKKSNNTFEKIYDEMRLNGFKLALISEVGFPDNKIYNYLDIMWVKKNIYDSFIKNLIFNKNK